ncbi:MAG: dihydropteroate synthase [Bacteroidaceae bacterium]|nr:dihydropteroate synthase [Bacteroidaceae bacterium]
MHYTININGKLLDMSETHVMGILNVTPDSFYAGCRTGTELELIRERVAQIRDEGASIIDIGAYSSRSGADDISAEEEAKRLRMALPIVRETWKEAIISVDTFRADIAKMCAEEYGVQIINDISAGELDSRMFSTVSKLGVPYIMMHSKGSPQTMKELAVYDNMMEEIILFFAERVQRLRDLGQKDIIIDPGFGFAKNMEQNYELMERLEELKILNLPILIGISRKSMIYKLLGGNADESLNGTTVLNTIGLMKGASVLRVHDVKECMQIIKIAEKLKTFRHL